MLGRYFPLLLKPQIGITRGLILLPQNVIINFLFPY